MKSDEIKKQREKALEYYNRAGIVLTAKEAENIEIAEFGLGMVDEVGLQLVTYINTDRVCAKELVLLPQQVCPEHRHIPTDGMEGKELEDLKWFKDATPEIVRCYDWLFRPEEFAKLPPLPMDDE